ncbi:uncharacterized protein [Dendrobates tinctorius]|uniref:uncharacterized protein n=1 Tax=Dendrobates tinctorius TaxID=92724 RepID=UPI003CC9DB1F
MSVDAVCVTSQTPVGHSPRPERALPGITPCAETLTLTAPLLRAPSWRFRMSMSCSLCHKPFDQLAQHHKRKCLRYGTEEERMAAKQTMVNISAKGTIISYEEIMSMDSKDVVSFLEGRGFIISNKPPVASIVEVEEPSTSASILLMEDEPPAIEDELPAVENQPPEVEDDLPAVENQPPEVEDELKAMENEPPVVSDEPAEEEKQAVVDKDSPTIEKELSVVEDLDNRTFEDEEPSISSRLSSHHLPQSVDIPSFPDSEIANLLDKADSSSDEETDSNDTEYMPHSFEEEEEEEKEEEVDEEEEDNNETKDEHASNLLP